MKIIVSSSLWKAILPFFSYAAHILEAIAAVTFASLSPDPAYDSSDPSWFISLLGKCCFCTVLHLLIFN